MQHSIDPKTEILLRISKLEKEMKKEERRTKELLPHYKKALQKAKRIEISLRLHTKVFNGLKERRDALLNEYNEKFAAPAMLTTPLFVSNEQ